MTGPPRPPPAMSFPSGNVVVMPFVGVSDENDGAVVLPQARLSSRSLSHTTTAHALLARMRSTAAVAASAMTIHSEPPPSSSSLLSPSSPSLP